jgi:transcriptional regulator with GAF, ATPase, and Fis domain
VRAAEGRLLSPAVQFYVLPLRRFPIIRRAMFTRRPVALDAHDHASEEGDPYDGVLDLPHGHSCMVVPLFADDRDLGIITLDRTTCSVYPRENIDVAGIFGQIVSTALVFAEQAALLDRYRHRLREHADNLESETTDGLDAAQALEASRDPAMRTLLAQLRMAAASDAPILLLGETGVGKEVISRAIHAWSPRAPGPFVKLNCAAIPENLVESELFGHVRGAFSGAHTARQGRFATADGGTLLLDELGEMPLASQARLLRVLQEGTFEPVGSDRTVKVDVRIIAATNVSLETAVREGRFREDLYYRLAVFPLEIPPLRRRPLDVLPIATAWLAARARSTGRGPWTLRPPAAAALETHPWPGNVRQLVNTLERATILQPRGPIGPEHLGLATDSAAPRGAAATMETPALPTYEQNEVTYLQRLLDATDGRIYGEGGAAELAELKPTTLQSKLKRRGLR